MHDEDIKQILYDAHNPEPDVRMDAVVKLRDHIDVPEVVHTLRTLIHDPDGHVRILAAEALAKARLYPEEALPVLITTLDVTDETDIAKAKHSKEWRRIAAGAIRFYGSNAICAIPALRAALLDPDENIRGYAAMSLGEIGNEAVIALQDLRAIRQSESNPKLRCLIDEVIKKIVGSEHFIVITKDEINKDVDDFRRDRFGRF